ncbi:MAG: serine protease AprX, partial [Blastocatellia bacterium]|nr:serine protease AprX [Blastocatellia bacterium]
MKRFSALSLLLVFSFFAPLVSFLPGSPTTQAQSKPNLLRGLKLAPGLRERARQSAPGKSDTTRVIVNLAEGADPQQLSQALAQSGAQSAKHLDELGLMIADIPLGKLEDAAARNDVSWISADQEVRSLATTPDNTSHLEITTGASKFLPVDQNGVVGSGVANGGAGSGVGMAILDSGITPSDAAEFVGYQWQQSSGTLGLGLLSQKYVQSYDRIKKHIDFTGENRTDDYYGHGTHTAGVAAGTGQASENNAAKTPGSPTYGGIATGSNLVDVRVLNSQGVGTISNVIAGINWVIKNKSTYNIRVMNLSLGTMVTQSYKTDPLCQAVGRAVDAGIVVVVAAGNWGKDSAGNTIYGGILSPANSPRVITVGATNTQQTDQRSDDTVTSYSSRGPTLVDGLAKPDLVAPGNRTGAAETADTSPSTSNNYSTTGGGGLVGSLLSGSTSTNVPQATGSYQILSGTSFAAPAVTGTVALILEANPSLTPSMVKAVLMRTAQRLPIYENMGATWRMNKYERIVTEGAGALNTSAAIAVAKAIRQDANKATVGSNLITKKDTTYSNIGVTAPIAGESTPLNNGIVWVEGVAFTDKL